ncbi:hypothetical protein [Dactylosporangium sp. CA-092794]|uniref:hypothetical protein n=1 Tax=Dactylosporangium sp. CA-092794 TaxID=3239929 RepID=UPI003D8DC52B
MSVLARFTGAEGKGRVRWSRGRWRRSPRPRRRCDGFRGGPAYPGTDTGALLALIGAGAGLALLPAAVLTADLRGVPVGEPLIHRTELIHGSLTAPAGSVADGLLQTNSKVSFSVAVR